MILLGRLASLFLYADTFAGASPVGEDFVIVVVFEGGPRPVAFHACAPARGSGFGALQPSPHRVGVG